MMYIRLKRCKSRCSDEVDIVDMVQSSKMDWFDYKRGRREQKVEHRSPLIWTTGKLYDIAFVLLTPGPASRRLLHSLYKILPTPAAAISISWLMPCLILHLFFLFFNHISQIAHHGVPNWSLFIFFVISLVMAIVDWWLFVCQCVHVLWKFNLLV